MLEYEIETKENQDGIMEIHEPTTEIRMIAAKLRNNKFKGEWNSGRIPRKR